MTQTGTYGTRNTVATGAVREDLAEAIKNISPVDTPFLNNIKSGTVDNHTPNWLVDSLAAASVNAHVEGADMSSSYVGRDGPVRLANVTQVMAKLAEVTSTYEAVKKAGNANSMAYQVALKMKELSNDIEKSLLCANYSAGTVSVARQMRSVCGDGVNTGWLNNSSYYGTGTLYEWSSTYANTNDLTETIFKNAIQAAWDNGGKPDLVLASPAMKAIISGFYGNTKATVNIDASEKKVIATVDYYQSDFGTVRIVPERHFPSIQSPTGTFYDFVAVLQSDLWEVGYLQKPKMQPMAKIGLSERMMISAELTLKALAPAGNALIQRCSRV